MARSSDSRENGPATIGVEGHSLFSANLTALIQGVESYGIDRRAFVERAGIDLVLLDDPTRRVDADCWNLAFAVALEETGDPCLGLRLSEFIYPTSYHALGFALLSSATLRSFCTRLARYYSFITTNESVTFETKGGLGRLVFTPAQGPSDSLVRALIEGSVAVVVRFVRFMYRPDFVPHRVTLRGEAPASDLLPVYERFIGSNIEFEAQAFSLEFDAGDLDIPLPAANAELARQNEQIVVNFLARMREGDLPARVHAKMIELLPSGECTKENVAKAVAMSVRALHNHLTEAGTTYQDMLDQTRKDLAEHYIRQRNLNVSEIAYLLGFSDASNFSRAFRRWTGVAPSEFRGEIRRASGAGGED